MFFLYRFYPTLEYIECIPLTSLRSREDVQTLKPGSNANFTQMFLNFHFSGMETMGLFKPNINGIVHHPHSAPPQVRCLHKY